MIRAIRINTISKLTFADNKRFCGYSLYYHKRLMNDVFPNIESSDIIYEELTEKIKEVLKEQKLDTIETQLSKILQFYEATK